LGWRFARTPPVARAETRNELASGIREVLLEVAGSPELAEALRLWSNGLEATPSQSFQAVQYVRAVLRSIENVHVQAGTGIVGNEVLRSYGFTTTEALWTSPNFPEFWDTQRTGYDLDFVATFEAEYDLAP
jgi:hypothetical protein